MKKFLIAVFVVLLVVLTACSTGRTVSDSYADKYIDLHLHLEEPSQLISPRNLPAFRAFRFLKMMKNLRVY